MKIEFWFEFASTYSYPAAMRIEALAASRDVQVAWRPFLLGPIFQQQGWNDSPFNIYQAKGRYMWRDMERVCERQDIPLRKPSTFPRNGLLPARVVCAHSEQAWVPGFVRAIYRANFADDADISSPAIVEQCLTALGQDAATILATSQTPTAKDKLKAQTAEAMERGVFGAPSFVVGDELFWGNDRLEDALAWARR
ncbi:2-hydroxychromene-2-carboxylate isomerase [Steroidobacter agaridevorans]|uniref:2-hydroxychromene-2-carboxylate isomerase n=1 Tax=Steroidobacter agaridevorans TaxID=2695856 RepID=A0A829YK72_9GAMM|nr:2-hydroxychromene-2-carboxylate isomerase [Steroidobacter agaridevorans]GFE83212.1 2-hydroxychromene-2-carboxylate isomerase [Steroidobacter agaridevorans]